MLIKFDAFIYATSYRELGDNIVYVLQLCYNIRHCDVTPKKSRHALSDKTDSHHLVSTNRVILIL